MTTNEGNSTTPPAVPDAVAPTKAEQRLAEQKVKREAKEAEKAKRKIDNAAKRADGVIGTLHKMLQAEGGTTKKEVLAALTEKFPDRDPIGMATTVGIQLSRLQKKHGKIVSRKQGERGLVYGYELTVKFQPESSPGAPDKTVAAADLMKQAGEVAGLPTEPGEGAKAVAAGDLPPGEGAKAVSRKSGKKR